MAKRARVEASSVKLAHPQQAIGKPWPVKELHAFDIGRVAYDIGYGQLVRDVLKSRGWTFSDCPCHSTQGDDPSHPKTYKKNCDNTTTVFLKEFEASLLGKSPVKAFGKQYAVQEGYRLKTRRLPQHALWVLGFTFFREPGSHQGRNVYRDSFAEAVATYGGKLPGETGNYRIGCFAGTYYALYKTAEALAFRDKPYYLMSYVLPKEADALLSELRIGGRGSYYIGKPENECGGAGIRVWEGNDPDLIKLVRWSKRRKEKSVVQRYLADPLLIGGLKFHMRIHMVVTSLSPPEAYVMHNGQALFATLPYSLSRKTLGSSFSPPVHVTNQSLNATPDNKINYFRKKPVIGKGQQISIVELENYLADTHPSYDKKDLWAQIIRIAADVTRYLAKARPVLKYACLKNRHFEIFGLDLMLDKKLNVYMCECNAGPGMDYPDKLILGSPNPDYRKEIRLASSTWHDVLTLLGLDAKRKQSRGSLKSWYQVQF